MSKQRSILLVANHYHPYLLHFFEQRGIRVINKSGATSDEVYHCAALPAVEGIITDARLKIHQSLIDKARALQWVGRLGSGLDHIDTHALAQRNIYCISTPEGNATAVAEHALGMLLSLLRRIAIAHTEVQQYTWKRNENRGFELSGKTVGIIGYGNTGSAFAHLLTSFGVSILLYDKYRKIEEGGRNANIQAVPLTAIYQKADIVSLHLPLTKETFHYADASFFKAFQKPFYCINTSRGRILHTAALLCAIKEGKVTGAALDVLENEQLHQLSSKEKDIFEQLAHHPRILLTPHIAGYTFESLYKMSYLLCEKLSALALI